MDCILTEATDIERLLLEGMPEDLIDRFYCHCYLLPGQFKETEKSKVVKLDKVCQTLSIYTKDIFLNLLSTASDVQMQLQMRL